MTYDAIFQHPPVCITPFNKGLAITLVKTLGKKCKNIHFLKKSFFGNRNRRSF